MPRCQTADKPRAKPEQSTATRAAKQPPQTDSYAALHADFHWQVPEFFNIAQACSRRWAEQAQTARQTAQHDADAQGDEERIASDFPLSADPGQQPLGTADRVGLGAEQFRGQP